MILAIELQGEDRFLLHAACHRFFLVPSLAANIKALEDSTQRLVEAAEMNMNYVKRSRATLFKILQQVRCKDMILYELLITEGLTRDNAIQFLGAIDEGITELRQIEIAVDQTLNGNHKGQSHRHGHGHGQNNRHHHQEHQDHRQLQHQDQAQHPAQHDTEEVNIDPRLHETKEQGQGGARPSPAAAIAARNSVNFKKEMRRLDSILPSMSNMSSMDEAEEEGLSTPLSTKYLRKHAAGDPGGMEESKKRMAALRHMRDVIGGKR